MTYGRVGARPAGDDINDAAVSHSAELVRGDLLRRLKTPSSAPSGLGAPSPQPRGEWVLRPSQQDPPRQLDIFFVEALINGLLLAGLLALLALGLNLIFGVIDVVWICYAEVVRVGMYGIHHAHKGGAPFCWRRCSASC